MKCSPLLIDCLINSTFYVKAMIDTGCLCYAVFDQNLVRENNLKTKEIAPQFLRLADGRVAGEITCMAGINLDIDGRQEVLWGYVMHNLAYPMILGKPWMEKNDVVYSARRRCLRIGSRKHGIIVRSSGWYEKLSPSTIQKRVSNVSIEKVALETGISFSNLIRLNKGRNNVIIGAVSINDITKALETKNVISWEEVRNELPPELQDFTSMFVDDNVLQDETLPSHRPGLDTKIKMQKDDRGQDKEVPWGPLYGMSREELLVLRKTLTELLDKNWIRASSSPGGAPVLFIKKPGGGLRFCVDYRALNAVTDRDRYPIPLIRETLRLMSGATWLSKVDVRAAFHRLRIAEGDEWKTAFRTRFGSYEWLVTPFGLAGAPAAFQRWINHILGDLLGVVCAAYLDDVVIFSKGNLVDHWKIVKKVMSLLNQAGLKLDPKKCEFATKQTKYLGYVVNVDEGIKVDPEKIVAITLWQAPRDVKGVRSFVGFANFYRNFIRGFTDIVEPLQTLTKKNAIFKWTNIQQEAFDKLKEMFTSAPILAMWQEDRKTVLETDASGWATGGCLSQYDDSGCLRPVAYFSKKLSPVECNYNIHDKELLAIIRCLNEWRAELIGIQQPFHILTDHKNLKFFMTNRKLTERHVRWSLVLTNFNFKILFRAGKQSDRPDALSRRQQDLPLSEEDPRLKEREFQLIQNNWITSSSLIAVADVMTEREQIVPSGPQLFEDEEIRGLWDKGAKEDEKQFHRLYKCLWNNETVFPSDLKLKISLSECVLDARGALCFRNRLWIPNWEPLQTALIQKTHDSHLTGHPGRNNTLAILSRSFFWPGMSVMVRKFCRNCDVCGRAHVWRTKRQGLLHPLPVPDRFHSELSIDFMTDLPARDKNEPAYLMVITDRLLKSVTLEAMNSMSAEECAERFLNCHFRFHGFPKAVTSDRGSNWVGDFWRHLCKEVNIEQRLSTAFHPETDGSTERMNQEVLAYLRAFISFSQYDWVKVLPVAQLAINNRDNSGSGLSPFFLQHGYHAEPIQQKSATSNKGSSNAIKRAENFLNRLREAQDHAAAAMAAAQMEMEEQANKKREQSPTYRIGDKVWLNLKNIPTPQPKKKLAWVNGKYSVLKVLSPHVVELDVPSKIWPRFHVDLLRKANEDPLPSQIIDDSQPSPVLIGRGPHAKPEQVVEKILRAESFRRGRGWVRRVLVKWKDFAEPNWEDRSDLEDAEALDKFELIYGVGDGVGEEEGARQGRKNKKTKKALLKKN